jgi:integrative and conjugative element protein (TIGR02256 family)
LRVCRAEIADEGRLGVLAYEGRDRNPRLDDLQAHLFGLARTDARIASWLQHAPKDRPDLEDIQLGLGCSSQTLRISDDLVSAHAAAFSRALRRLAAQDGGYLLLVNEQEDSAGRVLIAVPPVVVLPVSGRVDWSVRLSTAALTSMRQLLATAGRKETGGLLIGYVNGKRKIVYITHALAPSRDSSGTEDFFVRGTQGYPQAIKEIERKTGGLLGYVGDWHTHPGGPARPSALDHKTLAAIDRSLAPADIPGLLLIVSATAMTAVMSAR